MSTTTAIQGFLTWITGTTNADTAYNDTLDKLDKRLNLSVISMTTDAEPGAPSEGDAYIITGSATGTDWSTFDQYDVAVYRDAAWTAEAPKKGLQIHVQDESNAIKVWSGSAYVAPAGAVEFADNLFRIQDNGDATKEIAFEASGITTATTRTITVPDENITLFGLLDEDDMASDSASKAPSQQSVKAYVDGEVAGRSFEFSADVDTVADQDYVLWWDAPFPGSITTVRTKTQSGTCTVTGKIGATALGGTANSASTSAEEQAHSTDNTFAKGDKVLFTVSANSSATDLAVTFYGVRS